MRMSAGCSTSAPARRAASTTSPPPFSRPRASPKASPISTPRSRSATNTSISPRPICRNSAQPASAAISGVWRMASPTTSKTISRKLIRTGDATSIGDSHLKQLQPVVYGEFTRKQPSCGDAGEAEGDVAAAGGVKLKIHRGAEDGAGKTVGDNEAIFFRDQGFRETGVDGEVEDVAEFEIIAPFLIDAIVSGPRFYFHDDDPSLVIDPHHINAAAGAEFYLP